MSPSTPRKLHRAHFAFMRALAQGLDERTSWDRYLRVEGEHTDLRAVRRTIAWIRDAFAAAARREARPGTARLILLDPLRSPAGTGAPGAHALAPTLQAFAEASGMEDFSEEEQIEAYAAAHPPSTAASAGKGSASRRVDAGAVRRARLIERQLDALRWLEDLVAQDPRPEDHVEAWLNPTLAERLVRADLPTLDRLVAHINGVGARWWLRVPGIGDLKAARILEWLAAHEAALGFSVGPHARRARRQLTPDMLAAVVPPAMALVPLEKLVLPPHLDGHAGRHRADRAACRLAASNDLQAIDAWLATRRPPSAGRQLSATQRAYRKEAERLLLWAVLERGEALSSLNAADASAYAAFLAAPPSHWCGPRHHQRWSPLWRPLEGPLSAAARRHAFAILRSLHGFLVAQGYLAASSFAAPAPAAVRGLPLGAGRTLSFSQWDHLRAHLALEDATEPGRRLRRAVQWLYATGLRLSELASATCGDLVAAGPSPDAQQGSGALNDTCWSLRVAGRDGRHRQVPVPAALVEMLTEALTQCGMAGGAAAADNRHVAILMRWDPQARACVPWSVSAIYKAIKAFMARAAQTLEGEDAVQLRRASAHWLRHTHGTHALQGRAGRAALTLQAVQNNLGHASVATTSAYLATGAVMPDAQATQAFWNDL